MKASEVILAIQELLLIPEADRVPHIGTKTRIALDKLASLRADDDWVSAPAAPSPEPDSNGFPAEAIALILDSEGLDQPSKWPGGGSGITLGFGCDIGADPQSLEFWRGILTDDQIDHLAQAKGLTGRAAAQIATRFTGITVSRADAMKVFLKTSLPREIAITRKAYPGIDTLPPQVLGAMTSIVYNRGPDFSGDRRREMQAISGIIAGDGDQNAKLRGIASQIVSMKRLWEGQGLDGLLRRRDAEAALVRSAITA